jgi:hypothetical protein
MVFQVPTWKDAPPMNSDIQKDSVLQDASSIVAPEPAKLPWSPPSLTRLTMSQIEAGVAGNDDAETLS